MQIVIDIPDWVIDIPDWVIDKDEYTNYLSCMSEKLYEIIKNGIVLPKHGRLIDADALKKHKYHDSDRYENAVAVYHVDNAPTILEADKAESEE